MYRTMILRGDYSKREYDANVAHADAVWHQHVNSFNSSAAYALVEVARPVTERELAVAKAAADGYARIFGGGLGSGDGVKVLEDGDRAEYIIDNNREAYISEPAFGSNPAQARMLADPAVQRAIAQVNVDALRAHYPDGALIALSVGHKYKTSAPNDRGCVIVGTGLMEADVNEAIIGYMAELLGGAIVLPGHGTPPGQITPAPVGNSLVREFQYLTAAAGYRDFEGKLLDPDGAWGPRTDHVAERAIVKRGMRGALVAFVQRLVGAHDDGVYGSQPYHETYDRIRAFQKAHGLKRDGVVGHDTWQRMLVR